MTYHVQLCIIHPETFKAKIQNQDLTLSKLDPDYEDMVIEFFRQWDQPDKYDIMYSIGIIKMELAE